MGADSTHETSSDLTVTMALRRALRAEISRTGVTAITLLENARNLPEDLNARVINRWIGGITKTARKDHLDYVTARWAKLPDVPGRINNDGRRLPVRGGRHPVAGEVWIDLTPEMIAQLKAELARTGIKGAAILRGVENVPNGLSQRMIYGWLYAYVKTVNAAYWVFVIDHLKASPDRS